MLRPELFRSSIECSEGGGRDAYVHRFDHDERFAKDCGCWDARARDESHFADGRSSFFFISMKDSYLVTDKSPLSAGLITYKAHDTRNSYLRAALACASTYTSRSPQASATTACYRTLGCTTPSFSIASAMSRSECSGSRNFRPRMGSRFLPQSRWRRLAGSGTAPPSAMS